MCLDSVDITEVSLLTGCVLSSLTIRRFIQYAVAEHFCYNLGNQLNLLNAELNPICHFLALLGAHHILHVSKLGVNVNSDFFNKFIIVFYMFRALCAHHQEVKLYYTASGIVTLCRCWGSNLGRG